MTPRHINADQPTNIGYEGEQDATIVNFALPAGWDAYATSANTIASFMLPGKTTPVPYSVTVADGNAKWLVDAYACSKPGAGRVQLVLLADNTTLADVIVDGQYSPNENQVRAKDVVYDTICVPSVEVGEVEPSTPVWDQILSLVQFFSNIPEKVANKYLGTDSEKKWVFKDAGGSGTATITFVTTRPTTPVADILYAVGTHDNYVLESYHDGQWETFSGSSYPEYTGQTVFTPSTDNEQTGATTNHYLSSDITVHKIPRADVDNPAGGKTTTIG